MFLGLPVCPPPPCALTFGGIPIQSSSRHPAPTWCTAVLGAGQEQAAAEVQWWPWAAQRPVLARCGAGLHWSGGNNKVRISTIKKGEMLKFCSNTDIFSWTRYMSTCIAIMCGKWLCFFFFYLTPCTLYQ